MKDRQIVVLVKKDCDQLEFTNPAPDGFSDEAVRKIHCDWRMVDENGQKYISFKENCSDCKEWFNEHNAKDESIIVTRLKSKMENDLQIEKSKFTLEFDEDTAMLVARIPLAVVKAKHGIPDVAEEKEVAKEKGIAKEAEKTQVVAKGKSWVSSFCCLFTDCCGEKEPKGILDEQFETSSGYVPMQNMM